MKPKHHCSINTLSLYRHNWSVSNPEIPYSLREGTAESLTAAMREIRKAKKQMI